MDSLYSSVCAFTYLLIKVNYTDLLINFFWLYKIQLANCIFPHSSIGFFHIECFTLLRSEQAARITFSESCYEDVNIKFV